jgi:NAD(P)-dependent dehydrogenase (short-subunit alcohol dehydrogenase family)
LGRISSLDQARVARLADSIEPALHTRGQAMARTADVSDVDAWRRAARAAARRLGQHVRTVVAGADGDVLVAVVVE